MTYIVTINADDGTEVTFDLSRAELRHTPKAKDKYILTTNNGIKVSMSEELYLKSVKMMEACCDMPLEKLLNEKVEEVDDTEECEECGNKFKELLSYYGYNVCKECSSKLHEMGI